MSSILARFDRFWLAPAPAERLAMLRILVGGYALVFLSIRATHLWSYGDIEAFWFAPVGVVSLLPAPLIAPVAKGLVALCLAASFPFVLGYRYRLLAPVFAGLLLWVLTYANSFGKILHTDNLLCLHVIVLAMTPAADALSLDARRRGGPVPEPSSRYAWGIRLACLLCVCTYLLAGIAKIENSGSGFVEGDTLRNYIAFDNVRKLELGSVHSPIGAALLPYGWLFNGLAGLSLVLELGAPLALAHRRIAGAWALLVWGFHVGVLALMAIGFVYQIAGIAFAPFFRVERLLEAPVIRRLVAKRPPPAPTAHREGHAP